MGFTYWLPNEDGQVKQFNTDKQALVIIGANGSGKSKLGAWIEQKNFEKIHRIGAQRNLNFKENITLKSYSQAEDIVFYGSADATFKRDKRHRWEGGKSYTTKLLNDFEDVLAALIALKNNENDKFVEECKVAKLEEKPTPQVPYTSIDKLQDIWNEVFPHRKLRIDDSKFIAVIEKDGAEHTYSATQMSDGERSVLYLAAQVLCVPANKTLIMDEPEVHLHRSLMNRLWFALERFRPDCFFVYITHDTQFASMHKHADKIWIKEFDGQNWKFEKIENDELPEDLMMDILGNRNNVLFVEGEKGSYDTQLYTALYPQYYIVPCGSCTQVIARTKAFKNNLTLHHCEVYGIIDRDFRSDYEIEKYKEDSIYTIDVAEVENLFLVEELIRLMAVHMGKDADEIYTTIKKYIINERFSNQINGQICQSVVAQIKYKLSCAEISKKSENEAKSSLDEVMGSIDYEQIKLEQEEKFQTVLSSADYANVLKIYNEKNIAKSVGHFLGIENKSYCSTVVNLLKGDKRDEIVSALSGYLPDEIPR